MQGWERVINTLLVRRPQPLNTNPSTPTHRKKEEKGKTVVGDKK